VRLEKDSTGFWGGGRKCLLQLRIFLPCFAKERGSAITGKSGNRAGAPTEREGGFLDLSISRTTSVDWRKGCLAMKTLVKKGADMKRGGLDHAWPGKGVKDKKVLGAVHGG